LRAQSTKNFAGELFPTRFELFVNLETAGALGLDVAQRYSQSPMR
jgi:hypothetical protein